MFLHFRPRSLVGRGSDSFLVYLHTDLHIDNSWDSHHIRSRLEDKKDQNKGLNGGPSKQTLEMRSETDSVKRTITRASQ